MDKLKHLISQYDRWQRLFDYINRIEGYRESDFPLCVENAKSLLESIAKEICRCKGQQLAGDESAGKILKLAFGSLGYANGVSIQQIGGAIATIGHQMATLRNEIGDTAHGRPLEELEKIKTAIDKASSDFLLSSAELVSCFLIEMFEGGERAVFEQESDLGYDDSLDFNEFWDDQYGEFTMGEYSFPASQILFHLEPLGYRTKLAAYSNELDNAEQQ